MKYNKFETAYDKIVAPYQKDLMKNIERFVAINSVLDPTTQSETDPFGKGVSKALDFIYKLAKKDGFKATNYANKVVEILVGEGKKNLTIMAHADVVPAGSGWDQDPFSVTNRNGVLFGRGVADDKGPLLACYYAMKALRDNNMLGGYQIRFLVGGNEESGSLGIEYYFHSLKKAQPTLGFSPDSDFPLIFAEKGIGNFDIDSTFKIPHVYSIKGGEAANAVIDRCVVKMDIDAGFISLLKKNKVKFDVNGDGTEVAFIGKAAHGSVPWEGINAGLIAINYLGEYYKVKELKHAYKCFSDDKGKGLHADAYSPDMFDNSLNIGIISYENDKFHMVANFRYVNTADLKKIKLNIIKYATPLLITFQGFSDILYYPLDSVLVSTLLKAYQDETGDLESKPVATGGGTYAKEADNVVAFGMQFPGWDSKMHSPGESTTEEALYKGMAIYARAIVELGKKLK